VSGAVPSPPRPLAVADAPGVLAVIHAAFRAQPVPTNPPSGALRETVESIAAGIAAGGGAGIEAGGHWVAVVLWAEEGADALHLGRLAVLPAWRRRGLARALVAATEEEARRRGRARLTLGVRLALEGNRRLFAACGFAQVGTTCHPGFAQPTSALMEKPVAEGGADLPGGGTSLRPAGSPQPS
jgi:GNAT superfamily N-acetyltransferase